ADELCQLIPPVCGDSGIGVERKPVDTGTARTSEPWRLARSAKARADAPHVLAGPFPTRDAVLDGGRPGAGELWCGVTEGIIPGGHGGLHARLQRAPVAQGADHAPTELLDHGGNGGVGGRRAREKAGLQAYG